MFKRIILFIINFLSKLVYKDKFILCENNESPYRSNALVKVTEISPKHNSNTLDVIVTNDEFKCPAYPEAHNSSNRIHCSPLRRFIFDTTNKSRFFSKKKNICPIEGLHIHCSCEECGCSWIVFREVEIKSFEYK